MEEWLEGGHLRLSHTSATILFLESVVLHIHRIETENSFSLRVFAIVPGLPSAFLSVSCGGRVNLAIFSLIYPDFSIKILYPFPKG